MRLPLVPRLALSLVPVLAPVPVLRVVPVMAQALVLSLVPVVVLWWRVPHKHSAGVIEPVLLL